MRNQECEAGRLSPSAERMQVAACVDDALCKIAKSLELLQGKTYFCLLRAKKPCPAFCIILGQLHQAGAGLGGRQEVAGHHPSCSPPRPHPFCSSRSWLLSVMRWDNWAGRQLQHHPVHLHIILTYCVVIN